jgi:rhamnosyl/mannosyltransferase
VENLHLKFRNLFVSVGRLVPYKGYPILLRALQGLDAHLAIIGGGPLENELKHLAETLGVRHKVTFAGIVSRDEIKIWIHAARALVLSSVSPAEAFGLVQIEAMAAARPIINTNLPTAVPLVARHGMEALTVAHSDANALSKAMQLALDDDELIRRFGDNAQTRARSLFDNRRFRERNFAVYRAALQR